MAGWWAEADALAHLFWQAKFSSAYYSSLYYTNCGILS